ncbi:MAG: RIP metalloprotease RseP, partial [Candidatus Acidiferrales bacterium]
NGVKTPTWESVYSRIRSVHPGDSIALVVSRGNSEQTLSAKMPVPAADIDHVIGYPPVAPVIDEIAIGLPAEAAGMRSGDTITSINGRPVAAWPQLVDVVRKSNGSPIGFIVQRDGKEIPITVTAVQGMSPDGSTVWQIGVGPKLHTEFQPQGFFTAAQEAGIQTALGIKQIGDVLAGLFSGKVHIRELQGVVGIARISGQAAKRGTMDLIWLMATISLNLGLLNLLPIPILDGGHVLLLTIEGVIRRDLSIAVKERFVQVGLVFLLGIFAFVMYSDISKLIQSH